MPIRNAIWSGFSFSPFRIRRWGFANGPDDVGEFGPDDVLAQLLVGQIELVKIFVVEEMAERAVAHVMEQRRDPEKLFDVICRGAIAAPPP